jgi:hypothetical protein
MALPTLAKTWQINANNAVLAQSEYPMNQKLMYDLMVILTGFASNPWTVFWSSDGKGTAGVGLQWSDYTDCVWATAGNNHSWIVYNHPSGAQILFDMSYITTEPERCYVEVSPGGNYAADGTATDRPTASDAAAVTIRETAGASSNYWCGWLNLTVATGADVRYHVWHSSDGLVTRMTLWRLGLCLAFWEFGDLAEPRAGQTNPFCWGIHCTTPNTLRDIFALPSYLQDWPYAYTMIGAALNQSLYAWGLGTGSKLWTESTMAVVAEETDDEFSLTDIVYGCTNAGNRGPKGKAIDVWWSQYQALVAGDNFPASDTVREFVHCGSIALPWTGDATVMLTS